MPLQVKRLPDESWRDCVIRYAEPHGLEAECLADFDAALANGTPEARAAFSALYEWDCTDYVEDNEVPDGT